MVRRRNIIVVAARRSGTHLLTDLIVNNFGYESINYNYIDYSKFTGQPKYPTSELDKLELAMNKGGKVTWTHLHDYKDYHKYNHSTTDQIRLDKIFSESKVILIYRDIRDIINSCYHRPRYKSKYKDFTDFYNNFDFDGYELIDQNYDSITDLLIGYYKNWFSVYMSKELLGLDMEIISYEEIITNYKQSVDKISSFLEHPTDNLVDIRLPLKSKDVTLTTNDFRTGKVGEWIYTLGKELGEKIHKKYNIDVGIGFNYFLNDVQIHKYHTPERSKFEDASNWEQIEGIEEYGKLNIDIENRYSKCLFRSTDFRYYHKVFYFEDTILKFIYPCKASLDKDSFNSSIPIASQQLLDTIVKTDKVLYQEGIVPKLYYAGIYKGVLYVIQEKCPKENVICEKYNTYPQADDWSWPVKLGLHNKIKSHFISALKHNILLTDIVSVYNCALDSKGTLTYFDLDGIKYFNSREELLKSKDYENAIGIIKEIEKYENLSN